MQIRSNEQFLNAQRAHRRPEKRNPKKKCNYRSIVLFASLFAFGKIVYVCVFVESNLGNVFLMFEVHYVNPPENVQYQKIRENEGDMNQNCNQRFRRCVCVEIKVCNTRMSDLNRVQRQQLSSITLHRVHTQIHILEKRHRKIRKHMGTYHIHPHWVWNIMRECSITLTRLLSLFEP